MYRQHKSILWVWAMMLMSVCLLYAGVAVGDPLIITVRQAALLEAVPPAETIESTVENGVEILTPRSPQIPTGLDEQLAFIPEPTEDKPLDGQIERRRPESSAPPRIVVDRWQPGVYSNIVVDRRKPGSVPPIIVQRWPFARTSLTIAQRWPFARTSLTIAQRWPFARSSSIIVHGIEP